MLFAATDSRGLKDGRYFVYVEGNDPSGDGCRSTLFSFDSMEEANKNIAEWKNNSDIFNILVFEGKLTSSWSRAEEEEILSTLEPSEVGYLREQAGDFCPSCGAELAGNSICACQDSNEEAIAEQQSDKAREDEAERGFIREGYDDIPF